MGITMVLGGVRSGKSKFAEELAETSGAKILYVATGVSTDKEMEQRIEKHKSRRPDHWGLLETAYDLQLQAESYSDYDVVLVDCLSTWISNQLFKLPEEQSKNSTTELILANLEKWLETCQARNLIVVSSEVGLGGVAMSPLGRQFQDVIGLANQKLAAHSDSVYFIVSGVPWRLKG